MIPEAAERPGTGEDNKAWFEGESGKIVYAMDVLIVYELRQECIKVARHIGRKGRTGHAQPSRFSQGVKPTVYEVWLQSHREEIPPRELEAACVRGIFFPANVLEL